MADHSKAIKHFQLAITAAKSGDTKGARHHGGHAFNALADRAPAVTGAQKMAPLSPARPVGIPGAIPPVGDGGESDNADVGTPIPTQTGGGLMARLRSFGKKA